MRFFVFLACMGLTCASSGKPWGYGDTTEEAYGPADWDKVAVQCAGSSQSPINIRTKQAVDKKFSKDLKFEMTKWKRSWVSGTFANNGHAPTLSITSDNTGILSGGPLKGSYKLQQFHFHFGCSDGKGSEHLVDNQASPAELHLVFYNTKYADFSTAADKADGLAVIGVFLEIGSWSSFTLKWKLTNNLEKIIKEGSSVSVSGISLKNLVPDLFKDDVEFYTYKGSLTTPNCYESVRWIVFKQPITVTRSQLAEFRKLEATHGFSGGRMCDNFRPVQPLNGRTVYSADD